MLKFLAIVLIVYIASRYIRKIIQQPSSQQSTATFRRSSSNALSPTTLLSCPTCETFFHQKQGVAHQGKLFCSDKCVKW